MEPSEPKLREGERPLIWRGNDAETGDLVVAFDERPGRRVR